MRAAGLHSSRIVVILLTIIYEKGVTMKKITLFVMASCPYCREALRYMDQLYKTDKRYLDIPVEKIDENRNPEIANRYDYYYVPTFYVGDRKVHEGAASLEAVKRVFDEAMK